MSSAIDKLIKTIMLPSSLIMTRLSLRTKLLCMFATLILPICVLAVYVVFKVQADVDIANAELTGVNATRQIMDVMIQTQKHRGQVNLKLSGQNVDEALSKTRSALSAGLDQLDQLVKETPQFELAANWKPMADELRQLASGQIADSAPASIAQHSRLIADIMRFSTLVDEKSGLLLDPEAASYLLMDMSIQKMPVWIEHVALLRGLGAGYLKSGTLNFDDKAKLVSRLDALQAAMTGIKEMEAPLKRAGETILDEQNIAMESSQQFAGLVATNLLGEAVSGDASAYFEQGTRTIEKAILLQTKLHDRLSTILRERAASLTLTRNIISIGMLLVTLLTSYLLIGFYKNFMHALQEVGRSASAVASGDLSQKIHIDGRDELADTGNTLEKMNVNLSALVANVRSNATMVSQLGEQLSTGVSDLSIRTEQQASSLEETSASVEDLADTVKKNADSAQEVNELASKVQQIAESSGSTMQSAVQSMEEIQSSSLKVQEIVGVLDSLSFQTDILALNAAVEASRAGEQGRGFAVVASEVRQLAQRSADSSRQIRRLINESVHRVEEGVTHISEVSTTLSDIVSGIQHLASNINSISTASVEQSNGLAQISEALRHLDQITQSNGQMAEQAKHTSIDLGDRASALAKSVSGFTLRQGTANEAHAMVSKAVALYKTHGQRSLAMITADQQHIFSDRDMYVFAITQQGQYLAFGGNPEKLKVSLFNISGFDGRKLVADAFNLPATGGWVDYAITNPVSQKVELKTSYIERVTDNIAIGCGVYKIENG
ncbi:methyl-accepting chemotaxis protein [Undibacterium sp. SXout7W]|uniref:methyl-accepting chemotaxis protein n=1 Tax=Undibacterium sp. SXout7W TaxID=3413049 RepID=UPI003BF02215